jgi:integration host factor subunit beta
MTRSDRIVASIEQGKPGLRAEIERVVDVFFDEIAARLADGGRVRLRGFGAFSANAMPARAATPRTGDPSMCRARRALFQAGQCGSA